MLNVVIFGAPGSGKGTQSEKLIEKYGLSHVSTGDLLRAEMKVKSQLGQMAESYMSRGQLVPDDVVVGMLEGLIKKNNHVKGFIFDGFPRTLAQGKALDAMLVKYDEKVNVVLSLEVEDEELIARLLKRGEISGRSDDNKETIESRLRVRIPGQGSVDEIFASMEAVVDRIIV